MTARDAADGFLSAVLSKPNKRFDPRVTRCEASPERGAILPSRVESRVSQNTESIMRRAMLLALVVATASHAALAEDAAREARTYDVKPLRIQLSSKDYFAPEPLGLRQTAPADPQPASLAPALVDEGIRLKLKSMLRDAGSTVNIEGSELRVVATPEQHSRIEALFDRVEGEGATQITVETRFIEIPISSLSALDPTLQSVIDATAFAHQPTVLDRAEAEAMLRGLQDVEGVRQVSRPRITLGQGQHMYTSITLGTAYVARIEPRGQGSVHPIVETFESGTLVSLRASSASDGSSFAIAVDAELVDLIEMVKQPSPDLPEHEVQVPRFASSTVSSVQSIEAGDSALLRLRPRADTVVIPEKLTLLLVTATKPVID